MTPVLVTFDHKFLSTPTAPTYYDHIIQVSQKSKAYSEETFSNNYLWTDTQTDRQIDTCIGII